MICVDNSEWMRNGDYSPSRLQAQADAINLICGAKTQVLFLLIKFFPLRIFGTGSIFSIMVFVIGVGQSGEYSRGINNGGQRGSRVGHSNL